jgi:hypothetical protein
MGVTNEQVLTAVLRMRDELSPGMKKAQQATSDFDKTMGGVKKTLITLGTILAGLQVAQFIKSIINTASELEKLSKQTGVSTTNLQKIAASAKSAGGDIQDVAMGFRTLSINAQQAAAGNDVARAKFEGLGISIRDASGKLKSAEILFGEVADVIHDTESSTLRMTIAQELFGHSALRLLPTLEQGRDGLYAVGDAAERFGGILSKDSVKALDDFGNQLTATKDVMTAVIGNWLVQSGVTVPAIIDLFGKLVQGVQGVMLGWKIIFNSAWQTIKFFANAVNDILTGIVTTIAVFLAKALHPMTEFAKTLLQWFGKYLPDGIKDTLGGLISFADNLAGKGLVDPLQETISKIDKGWEQLGTNVDKYNNETAANTVEKVDLTLNKLEELKAAIGAVSGTAKKAAATPVLSASAALDDLLRLGGEATNAGPNGKVSDAEREIRMKEASLRSKLQAFQEETGIKVTTEQLRQLAIAAQQGDESLKKMLDDIKRMAEADPFTGFELAIYDLSKASYSFRDAWTGIFNDLKSGFSDMFANAIEGTDSFSNGFKKAMKSLKHDLIKMFTDFATSSLFQSAGGGLLGMLGLGGGVSGAPGSTTGPGSNNMAQQGTNIAGQALSSGGVTMSNFTTALGGVGMSAGSLGAVAGLGAAGTALAVSGVSNGNVTQGTVGGIVAGASMGAIVGSIIPGLGTVAGAVIGGIIGGVTGYLGSSRKKRKKAREAARHAAEALAAYNAAIAKARVVLKQDIRNKMGGGLATEEAASDYGRLFSGDLSADEIMAFGDPAAVAAKASEVNRQTNVNAPITVNAQITGSYDVAVLAQELSYHLQNQMGGSAGGI